MALSCGSRCAKYILFAFNLIFWLAGAALLGVGIWFRVDSTALQVLDVISVDTSDELVRAAAYTVITVGAIVFLTGFLGCCGAMNENSCMLITYAVVLGILLILEVTAGILGVVYRNKIMDTLDSSMNKTVHEFYGQNGHEGSTTAWDFTQVEFKCCGATVGPSDWTTSLWATNHTDPVPLTCCVLLNSNSKSPKPVDKDRCMAAAKNPNMANATDYIHTEGCKEGLKTWVRSHSAVLIGIAFAVAAIQIIAMAVACCLRNAVKSGYEYV